MEAARRTTATHARKRKPLADRTNTTAFSLSAPPLNKLPPPPHHPSSTSATIAATEPGSNKTSKEKKQRLVGTSSIETRNQTRRKLADTATPASRSPDEAAADDDANKENVSADANVHILPDVPPPPTTPAERRPLYPLVEPLILYARSQTVKRKGKGKVVNEVFTCLPVERKRKESKVSKCLSEPPKKRRTKEHVVSKDYFEQQKAYFAEIDECELLEEEVSESELSDH